MVDEEKSLALDYCGDIAQLICDVEEEYGSVKANAEDIDHLAKDMAREFPEQRAIIGTLMVAREQLIGMDSHREVVISTLREACSDLADEYDIRHVNYNG